MKNTPENTFILAQVHEAEDAGNLHEKTDAVKDAHSEVQAKHGDGHGDNPLNVDFQMVLWTWITFALLLAVLYKFAFKPILAALDGREKKIRDSLENAEKARLELENMQQKSAEMIAAADTQAKEIISQARDQALETAKMIDDKAKEEAQKTRDNALKDIETAKQQASDSLRRESAELAISLAGKIIGENLDDAKNRSLTEKLISEL